MFDFFVMDPIIGFYFFCLSGYVQICGRPQINFTRSSEKYIQFLHKHFVSNNRKLFTTFLAAQKLPDDYSGGLFSTAYEAEFFDRNSQTGAVFVVEEMRENLISC